MAPQQCHGVQLACEAIVPALDIFVLHRQVEVLSPTDARLWTGAKGPLIKWALSNNSFF